MPEPITVFQAMGFPPKVITAFAKARPRVATIGDLIALTPADVLRLPGVGPNALGQIEIILKTQKLALAAYQKGHE
ncbi:MAG: hypothetical protein KGJ57_17660 [Sphingomonadales bacterium]|nr:hypothetical protein [Sphingomonadales bacterium]MDE2171226.1 hypothetical protein [Sphingomonadales bacterium]